jgi:hypothetical protein
LELGAVSQRSSNRQTIFVADAHRGDSQRSVAHANDKLTAFLELEAVIRQRVKDWEIIADNPSKAGWRWGWISALDSNGRTIWIADAHRDNGKRFVVRSEEKLTACLELERVTQCLASHN